MSSRRSKRPGSKRTWPSRPTPRRRGAASVGRRPTAATPACCASCWRRGSCPRVGSHPSRCWSGGNGCGCMCRWCNQRTVWCQRIHAELYHHGVAVPGGRDPHAPRPGRCSPTRRCSCRRRRGSGSAVGYRMIDATDLEAQPLKRDLQRFGARQPACRALVDAQVRDRRVDRGGGVVRARRLPTLLAFRTSGAPHRPRRDRRLLGPAPRRWVPLTPGSRDAALGALRSGQELLASPQPRPRSTTRKVKERHDGKIAAISVARQFARRCYHVLRNLDPDIVYAMPELSTALGSGGWHRPPRHQGHPRSAPATGVPASIRAGRPSNTDATALPTTGGHPITIVVADDTNSSST